uniref:Methyltransferase domain-containing protein n=1 Tax=Candidatus Kentrum sp. FM TaxID=2126340 RepID=A0A450VS08_9GAMM|nr:MAG: Methyltransferase domain-containing protein [Candidatus Kentron sp. FM]VFJ47361.1 MAG: Methyltransferase domain-containing protein [Candidatus Kentron sp. FM]VFK07565.1 MAG: Methyltransferase domain-containing protein [Candidatus Kentron sp. FM]
MMATLATEPIEWTQRVPERETMDDAAENAAYDRLATTWLSRVIYPILIRELDLQRCSIRILDACSGTGRFTLALARAYPNASIEGIDLSMSMLRLAHAHARAANITERVIFSQQNVSQMAFEDNFFDVAFSYGSLHHWNAPQAVFAELARVVRPGGSILVGDWRRDPVPLRFFRSIEGTKEWDLMVASVRAAYQEDEVQSFLKSLASVANWQIRRHAMGLLIRGDVTGDN